VEDLFPSTTSERNSRRGAQVGGEGVVMLMLMLMHVCVGGRWTDW